MTEVEVYREPATPVAAQHNYSITDLAMLADRIARTGMVPASLRNKPDEVLATLMYGVECGLPAMQSLQLIDMMQGRPTLNAQGQRALILAAGHEFWIDHSDATRAVVKAKRKGTDRELEAEFTIAEAQQRQLTGKDNWKKQPEDMLVARATTRMARRHFSDVVLGLAYDAEELEPVRFTDGPAPAALAAPAPDEPVSDEGLARFRQACEENGLDPVAVVARAFPDRDHATILASEMPHLRDTFKAMLAEGGSAPPSEPSSAPPSDAAEDQSQSTTGSDVSEAGVGADGPDVGVPAPASGSTEDDRARRRFFAVCAKRWPNVSNAERNGLRKAWLVQQYGVDSAAKLSGERLLAAADRLEGEVIALDLEPEQVSLDEVLDAEVVE